MKVYIIEFQDWDNMLFGTEAVFSTKEKAQKRFDELMEEVSTQYDIPVDEIDDAGTDEVPIYYVMKEIEVID